MYDFFLPTELKVEEILNVKLIFLFSRINTEVRFGNNRHFITPPHLPTPSKVVNLMLNVKHMEQYAFPFNENFSSVIMFEMSQHALMDECRMPYVS